MEDFGLVEQAATLDAEAEAQARYEAALEAGATDEEAEAAYYA